MTLIWMIPLMVFLLLFKAFFSGSEIALVNADRLKLGHAAKRGSKGAGLVVKLLRNPERILATTLVGTNIATVVLTTLGTLLMVEFFGEELGDLYAVLVFTPFLLILGEIVPKSVFQQKADAIAPVAVFPLRTFSWLFSPIVLVFSTVARMAAKVAGRQSAAGNLLPIRDQLRHLIEMADRASEAGVFDRFRIERAIRFSETTVGEEMVPVGDIVGLDASATTAEAIQIVRRRGFNHLPVFEGHMSNIVGIASLTIWDLLEPSTASRPLSEFIRPAQYVSRLQTLDEVRPILREREDQMGIVVDEFGSAVGLISLLDVMAAVVGDIETGLEFEDSSPRQTPKWEAFGDDAYLMDGRLSISQLNDLLGLELPSSEFQTVGGMLMSRLRHLARPGDSLIEGGFRFTVEEASERAVKRVRVERERG